MLAVKTEWMSARSAPPLLGLCCHNLLPELITLSDQAFFVFGQVRAWEEELASWAHVDKLRRRAGWPKK